LFGKITGGRICPFVCIDVLSGSESEHGMEQSVLDSGMEVSIEDVLSGRKEPEPVVLLIITVESKVLFQFLVGLFCLAVCLRVIQCRWGHFDRELFLECFDEFGNKGAASI